MVTLFKRTQLWAVEYRYEGRTRHWLKTLPQGADAPSSLRQVLADLYGSRAKLVSVRPATPDEEAAFNRGEEPSNAFCPTGRQPLSRPKPPALPPGRAEPVEAPVTHDETSRQGPFDKLRANGNKPPSS